MKKVHLFLMLSGLVLSSAPGALAQRKASAAATAGRQQARQVRDLAAQTTYYMVLLKAPKDPETNIEAAASVRAAHMAFLQQLRQEGKLALAGSCPGADQNLHSMYLLKVTDLAAAQVLTATDPSVKLGRLTAEVYPWVGQTSGKL
ncbi:YciI family protein [Hymenobacter persicinus]|nr:YciI family protein [Hymenobacter persicinus]